MRCIETYFAGGVQSGRSTIVGNVDAAQGSGVIPPIPVLGGLLVGGVELPYEYLPAAVAEKLSFVDANDFEHCFFLLSIF